MSAMSFAKSRRTAWAALVWMCGVGGVGVMGIAQPVWAQASNAPVPAGAAYLASNCANCHGIKGSANGAMPSLAGRDAAYITEQLRLFRDGKRSATLMHQIAKGYSDEQIAAIAAYFAAQKK